MVAGVLNASANAEAGCPAFLPVWVSSEVFYACYQQMSWLTFELVFYSISLHSLNKMYCLTLREHFENHHHQSHLEYSQRSLGSPPCPHFLFLLLIEQFLWTKSPFQNPGVLFLLNPPPPPKFMTFMPVFLVQLTRARSEVIFAVVVITPF